MDRDRRGFMNNQGRRTSGLALTRRQRLAWRVFGWLVVAACVAFVGLFIASNWGVVPA